MLGASLQVSSRKGQDSLQDVKVLIFRIIVEGLVCVSPDPSFSLSESDSFSRGTSVAVGSVIGRITVRARSAGVSLEEEAPVF